MVISTFDWVLLAALALQELTAAVKSMNVPQKSSGAYCFWYKFLRQSMNIADETFEKKFNITMPRVVDETAIQKVITPTSSTETAVTKTTTTT